MLAKIYIGSRSQGIVDYEDLPLFGAGKHLSGTDCIEKILRQLIAKSVLYENHVRNFAGFVLSYVKVGTQVKALMNGTLRIEVTQPIARIVKAKKKKDED